MADEEQDNEDTGMDYDLNEETPESPDIISEYDDTPDGELKQSLMEENSSDPDFDYQQGFNYPEQQYKDSITKFYRHIISLMQPKKIVRVANFRFKEAKNAKLFLNLADYNRLEGCDTIAIMLEKMAINEAAVSMGKAGFIVTNIMTQRRVVQRQTEKKNPVANWANPNKNK